MANKNKTPEWLTNIQENSWNVELFISIGFAFVLLKLPQIIDNLSLNLIAQYGDFATFVGLRFVIHLALLVLPIGFITHLVFRGIWIGLVGFSYVFPEGFQTDKLKYPNRYRNIIDKSKNPIEIIIKLEKICSLIYTFTFLLFFILLAIFNFFLIGGIALEVIQYLIDSELIYTIFQLLLALVGLIYALDFFTAGFFKKNRITSKVFYPIYIAISAITFAKLYRTQYYTLISRYSKLKVSLILFLILMLYFLGSFLTTIKTDRRVLYSTTFNQEYLIYTNDMYYDQIPEGHLINNACIQSDIIRGDHLKLLICHKRFREYQLNENINIKIDSLERLGNVKNTYNYIKSKYNDLYNIIIDNKLISDIDWLFTFDNKTIAGGIISYLDISQLSKGHHTIRIKLKNDRQISIIHFWKE